MLTRQNGFTIVELSIVLTIISLIVGGILVGESLLRSARVNSIITDVQRYTQAVANFHDKYTSYPGDMSNAQTYWGIDPGGCPTPTTGINPTPYTTTKHRETCNGDGNGYIGALGVLDAGSYVANGPGAYEWYRAWQQLSDAGFIENSFTGVNGNAGTNSAIIGQNVPASQVPGAGYSLFYASYPAGNADWWPIMDHVLVFGSIFGVKWTYGPALTTAEAFGIDSKIDDGLPSYGKVQTFTQNSLPNCGTTNVQSTAKYNTAYTAYACNMVFDLGF